MCQRRAATVRRDVEGARRGESRRNDKAHVAVTKGDLGDLRTESRDLDQR